MRWWRLLPLALAPWFPLEAHASFISGLVNINILSMGPGDSEFPRFCGQSDFGNRPPCGLGQIYVTKSGGRLFDYDFSSYDFPQFDSSGLAHDLLNNARANGIPTYNIIARGEQGLNAWLAAHPDGVVWAEDVSPVCPCFSLGIATGPQLSNILQDAVTNTFFPGSRGFWQTGDPDTNQTFNVQFTVLSVDGLVPMPEPSGLALLVSAFALSFGFTITKRFLQ